MSDGYTPRNEGTSFSVQISVPLPLLKVSGNSAQLVYIHTVIISEVQQTRYSFGKWPVKPKFQSNIALFGK